MTGRTNRITSGLRQPAGEAARPPRVPIEAALVLLHHIKPWAAPRLPDDVLACFDLMQRQFRPLPAPARPKPQRKAPPGIPVQRRPHPLERLEARRARR